MKKIIVLITFTITSILSAANDTIYKPVIDSSKVSYTTLPELKKYIDNSDFDYSEKIKNNDNFLSDLLNYLQFLLGSGGKTLDWTVQIIGVLVLILVAFLLYKFIVNKEANAFWQKSDDKEISDFNEIASDILEYDLKELIRNAEEKKHFRAAVRFLFLESLKKMNEKKWIEWNADKTNKEYEYELKNNELRENYRYLSYLYDYSWYGNFSLEESTYEKIKNSFQKFLNGL